MSGHYSAMNPPLVSITTATFNSEKTLGRTIESVLCQDYPLIEYTIMDGASADGTVDLAESYACRFKEKGFAYRVVSEADRGMYDAINKAMDLSHGVILGNINSDDWYESSAISKVAAAYMSNQGFDLLYGDLMMHAAGKPFVKKARPIGLYETSRKWNHPTTFLANEGRAYRYRLDNLYADYDLFIRVREDGGKIVILNEVLANFSFGGVSTEKSFAAVRERIRWRNQVLRDNHCSPLSYIEGAVIDILKYIRA